MLEIDFSDSTKKKWLSANPRGGDNMANPALYPEFRSEYREDKSLKYTRLDPAFKALQVKINTCNCVRNLGAEVLFRYKLLHTSFNFYLNNNWTIFR